MTIPSTNHYFEQAEASLSLYPRRKARQTELRRAVSVAYYRVFHFVLAQAADLCVGIGQRPTPRYALVYRSISHTRFRETCLETMKTTPSAAVRASFDGMMFGPSLRKFSHNAVELQEERHAADYDPSESFNKNRTIASICAARSARDTFLLVPANEREVFLTLQICSPRRA